MPSRRITTGTLNPRSYFGPTRLKLDLNSDRGVVLASSAVAGLVDQSGNGIVASQGTASARPTYVTNAIAGHACVRFDGGDDYLLASVFSPAMSAGSAAVYIVYSTSAGGGSTVGGSFDLYQNGVQYGALYHLHYYGTHYARRNNGGGSYNDLGGTDGAAAGPRLIAHRLTTGSEGGFAHWLQRDNSVTLNQGTTPNDGLAIAPNSLVIGRENSGPYYLAMDLYRFLVIEPSPTIAEHAVLISYLKRQYPTIAIA